MDKKKVACQVYLEPDLHDKVKEYQAQTKRASLSNTIEFLMYLALKRAEDFKVLGRL